jgi:quercetin dioxygenase-like cupin family protein
MKFHIAQSIYRRDDKAARQPSFRPFGMRRPAIAALGLLAMTALSRAENPGGIAKMSEAPSPAVPTLRDDQPVGTGATITAVSGDRPLNAGDAALSTFVVEYAPGGSAVLESSPSHGYVLMYVLSGSIQASAWAANVGVYRTGKTWVVPAFAHNIATKNTSAVEPARALVVLFTGPDRTPKSN